jgi:hypothetical protein
MSRGPGYVERAIEELFTSSPTQAFSTDELVAAVYPGVNRIEKKHRVAVLRAADKVAKRLRWEKQQCERFGWGGEGRGSIYFNKLDVHSYAIGRMRADFVHAGESVSALETRIAPDGDHAEYVAHGGSWWIHVQQFKIEAGIPVDAATKKLIAARQKERDQPLGSLGLPTVSDEEQQRRRLRHEANEHGKLCAKCGKAIEPGALIVRQPVVRSHWLGTSAVELEVWCLDCSNNNPTSSSWQDTRCDRCGRPVVQPCRRNRLRTYCCEDCRRPIRQPRG